MDKLLDQPPVALGGVSGIAAFALGLAQLFEFRGGRFIDSEVGHELGSNASLGEAYDLERTRDGALPDSDSVAGLEGLGRLGGGVVETNLAVAAGIGRLTAGLE